MNVGECTAGYYSVGSGYAPCTAASAGYYVSGPGAQSQSACPAGYYQPNTGASSCDAAGLGYSVATSGQANEVACPAGETTLVVASTSCVAPTTLTASSVNKEPGLTDFSARLMLTLNGKGVGGQTIVFKIGPATVCTAVTAANGVASCSAVITLNQYLNANSYTASYAGSTPYLPATAIGSFYTAPPPLNIP